MCDIIIREYTPRKRKVTNPTVDMVFCNPIFFPCIGHHDYDSQSSNISDTIERRRTIVIEQHNKKFLDTIIRLSKQPARMNQRSLFVQKVHVLYCAD